MPHEHAEVIEQVVTEVLEQLAFVFADCAEHDELPSDQSSAVAVSMGIRGAGVGRLVVASGVTVCQELAGNLLGSDPEEATNEQSRFALMELVNVLCGQLLTELSGTEPVFDLDPPESIDDAAETWRVLTADPSAVGFLADDCPMLVRLELDMPASQAA
jgi:CheY-specific phosphatase CheX